MKKLRTLELERLSNEGLSLATGKTLFVKHLPLPGNKVYQTPFSVEQKLARMKRNLLHKAQRREITQQNLKHCRPALAPEIVDKMRLVVKSNQLKRYNKKKGWWEALGDWVPFALAWSKEHKELDVLK